MVSLVLVRVDNGVQGLFYYVSKSLHEAEVRYLPLENAIFVVMHATQIGRASCRERVCAIV